MTDDHPCPYPDWLCDEERFVKVKPHSKEPAEAWGRDANRYAWHDDELVAHREAGGNAHILSGDGLVVIDIDGPPVPEAVDDLPDTFVVKTPGGGKHLYYRSEYDETHGYPWGEIYGAESLMATPGNAHPSGGEYYILWDRDIKGVPEPLMERVVDDAEAQKRPDDAGDGDGGDRPPIEDLDDLPDEDERPDAEQVADQYDWMQSYPNPDREDRSTFEWAVCCTMIRYGVPKREVEQYLRSFPESKCRERGGLDYGDTWERARREVGTEAGTYTLGQRPTADDER